MPLCVLESQENKHRLFQREKEEAYQRPTTGLKEAKKLQQYTTPLLKGPGERDCQSCFRTSPHFSNASNSDAGFDESGSCKQNRSAVEG